MRPLTMAFRLAPTSAASSSHLNLLAASDSPMRYPIRSSNLSSGISSRNARGCLSILDRAGLMESGGCPREANSLDPSTRRT